MNYSRSVRVLSFACLLLMLGLAGAASGQWVSETFQLSNGWNAIYLRGTPFPADLDSQFASMPIRAVHRNYLQYDTTQFTESSGDLPTRGTEWLVWYPSNSPHRVLTTLWSLSGNGAYLIECYTSCTWTVKGTPVVPERLWLPSTWNFVGLPVNPSHAVTFVEFFRNAHNIDVSPSPTGGKVYRTKPDGTMQDITSQTAMMSMNPKESYWILTQGLSAFIGSVRAQATLGALRFPAGVTMASFTLLNACGTNQQVSIRLVSSEAPPSGATPRMGDVPLLQFVYNEASGKYEWEPVVSSVPITKTLGSNEEWEVSLAVDRTALTAPSPTNATWQSILEVTDEIGTLIRIPVTAEYGGGDSYDSVWPYGLWVGDVTIGRVSMEADGVASEPLPTTAEMTMRLILHFGTNGQKRLLQQAVVECRSNIVSGVTNHYYRIHANGRGVAAGAEASRISSVAFPYGLNVAMDGDPLSSLSASYVIGYNDAVNPFKHIYNPNHNNVDANDQPLAEGVENYTISNEVHLVVAPMDAPSASSASLWNPEEELSGSYTQRIYGLRKQPVTLGGTFRLQRVSKTGVLE